MIVGPWVTIIAGPIDGLAFSLASAGDVHDMSICLTSLVGSRWSFSRVGFGGKTAGTTAKEQEHHKIKQIVSPCVRRGGIFSHLAGHYDSRAMGHYNRRSGLERLEVRMGRRWSELGGFVCVRRTHCEQCGSLLLSEKKCADVLACLWRGGWWRRQEPVLGTR
jgi:hypothetical protein